MSWKLLIKVLVVHVFASCDILPQQTGIYDLLQASVVSPAPTFINDSSAPTSNTSFDNVLKLRCDPVRYGRNLKVESCRKILGFISESDEQSVFADRGSVQPHDSNLPFRATSNDARCYAQPILAEGAVTARASPKEFVSAASTLFYECVVKRGVGGIVGDIGGDNKLDVIMASYNPNVRCNSLSGPPWRSCVGILANMHADKYRQTFGHLPDERVQVQLPFTYEAEDGRCMIKVDITGQPTGLSWYEVWEAAVALTATCVRGKQQPGKATGLGLGRNIFIQLSDKNPDATVQPLLGTLNSSSLTSD